MEAMTSFFDLAIQGNQLVRYRTAAQPSHEKRDLSFVGLVILQTRMCSHPTRPDLRLFVSDFLWFLTLFERTAKVMARLRRCEDFSEPFMFANVLRVIFVWAVLYIVVQPLSTR